MPRPHASPRRAAGGFTLVELAVVVGVLGMLALAMTSTFDSVGQARQHNAARAHAESARQALRAFVLRNKRLPCPDTSPFGDVGREAGGGSCGSGANLGWLPYETLGLDVPVRQARLRYAVHRGAGGADLVAPSPASNDIPDLEGTGGLIAALARVGTAPSAAQPHYVAGHSAACAGGDIVNPAYVLVAPAADLDGLGGDHPNFDGIHRAFAEGTSLCTAPPDHPADLRFDDVVVAESASALLGWLMTATR